ncbi:MAG: DUF423 domain-containing protein [Firmicutes bacterium]|nr:DUF423 domain-containing protein [Bacillota bacterium]
MFLVIGAVMAFLAVLLGAFGAHALRGKVTAERLASYQTGVQYQMFHGLALLVIGLWTSISPSHQLIIGAWCLVVGIVLFSGSLYLLTVTGVRRFGAITPLGGVAFLGGWVFVFLAALHFVRP